MDATSVSQDQAKPEDKPQPQEPTPTHRGGGTWLLWLFIALTIYVLSTGPVCKVTQALHLPQKTSDRVLGIYFPVGWCADLCPPFGHALRWYLFTVWKLDD